MNAKRKILRGVFPLFMVVALLLVSCEKNSVENNEEVEIARTGRVHFFNESSYRVNVRLGSFVGVKLTEIPSGGSRTVDVRISDDHGLGTTFAMEFLFQVNGLLEIFDPAAGDIFIGGEDHAIQPNIIIVEGETHNVQIPQPQNLTARGAILAISNEHNLPADFRSLGGALRQTNNNIPIQPGATGVFRIEQIPASGLNLQVHSIWQGANSIPFPAETTFLNGFIYRYYFNGTEVRQLRPPQTIVF